jgi:DNA polymerase III delta prime subunit
MNLNSLWVEKFRPSTLNDLIIDDKNRNIIESFGKNIPNLLFCGKPGCGKTSLAKIIVQDIVKGDYLYINASDENGIDTIREKVIGFAQTMSFNEGLKVVILDESDYLSKSSQAALRNVMESYSKTTRFILTGNHIHKISGALRSRCQQIDLKIDIKSVFKRCLYILSCERIQVNTDQKKALLQLVQKHFPDLRKCINEMQKQCIDGVLSISSRKNVEELCETIFNHIQRGDTLKLRKYVIENEELFDSDYDLLLRNLLNHYYSSQLEDITKKQAILTIADHLFKIVHVSDQEICFFACMLALEA